MGLGRTVVSSKEGTATLFPERELLDETISPTDVLRSELRLYPHPNEFQSYVDRCLEQMHGHSPTGQYCRDVADILANEYAITHDIEPPTNNLSQMFFAGSLLALHTTTTDLPDYTAQELHSFYPADVHTELASRADEMLVYLDQIHQDGYETGDREAIEHAAVMYAPIGSPEEQYLFSMGYRYGFDTICMLAEEFFKTDSAA